MKTKGTAGAKASAKKAAARRQRPSVEHELKAGHPSILVAGVDEVGRGCLAGPVVAAAVILPSGPSEIDPRKFEWLKDVDDSKSVRPEVRERLVPLIEAWAFAWAVGVASVEEIDRVNIYQASHLAMLRAIQGLAREGQPVCPGHVLVDGKFKPRDLPCEATAIIQGDRKCLSIAAASILAKVWRDRHMKELDVRYPGYGFGVHKGYSTPEHSRALRALGVCELHRRSFAPVAALVTGGSAQLGFDLATATPSRVPAGADGAFFDEE